VLTEKNININISLDKEEENKLNDYLNLLEFCPKKINLVGFKNVKDIYDNLIVDSFYLYDFIKEKFKEKDLIFFDLGSGAGIPGIPFKILYKEGIYYLIEIRKKRVVFLKNCILKLKLENTFIIDRYAQEVNSLLGRAHIVIARAFKPYLEVLALAKDLLLPKGKVIILANEQTPKITPSSWILKTTYKYQVKKKNRYFWLFELNI